MSVYALFIFMQLKVSNCKFITLKKHCEGDRGQLLALEGLKDVPFEIKRIYAIVNVTNNVTRGRHAHIRLEQVAFCLSGSCRFLLDDGRNRGSIKLNASEIGLYIGKLVWREMFDFSQDCVLTVLASEPYDADDYVRDYKEFLKIVQYGSIL